MADVSSLFRPRIVDFFSLPTHNLTEDRPDAAAETFHHSRLMGVSDLENAVKLTTWFCSYFVYLMQFMYFHYSQHPLYGFIYIYQFLIIFKLISIQP